jgi:hypothetical protein
MAGKPGHVPMVERVRLPVARRVDCPARDCWVSEPADLSGQKLPGLHVGCRPTAGPAGCEGRVVHATELRHDRDVGRGRGIGGEVFGVFAPLFELLAGPISATVVETLH